MSEQPESDTQIWTTPKSERRAIWKLGWFRCFLYASVVFFSTLVALTENWSDVYLEKLHLPVWLFAIAVVLMKCYVPTSTAIIAYMDQTIQQLREEAKSRKANEG